MGVALVKISKPKIKPVSIWVTGVVDVSRSVDVPQRPLAYPTRRIANLFQSLGDRQLRTAKISRLVSLQSRVPNMLAGPERQPRGTTHGVSRIMIGEAQALLGDSIQMRRFNDLLSIATQIAVAQVIGHHENNIRPLLSHHNGGLEHR